MMFQSTVVTAILATLATATPVTFDRHSSSTQNGSITDLATAARQYYSGDGSATAGWPEKSQWVSFESMFNSNMNTLKQSCVWNGYSTQDNTDEEIGMIKGGIQAATAQTHVDQRFILAVIMQESKGCVRVHTTSNGVRNPGLMQDHDGLHTCNDNGSILFPCPRDQIFGMISDGTVGTDNGDGLVQLIDQATAHNQASGGAGVSVDKGQVYYQAARLYNSGSTNPIWDDLNNGNGATAGYANDIANRLMGWVDS